jgi:hypothetical protein
MSHQKTIVHIKSHQPIVPLMIFFCPILPSKTFLMKRAGKQKEDRGQER